MLATYIVPVVLLAVIFLILFNYNRTLITLGGAVITTIVLLIDKFPFKDIISFLVGSETPDNFANFHTLVLIFGLLIITSICNDSGVFSYIALKIIQKSQGNKYILLFLLCLLAFGISVMLSNLMSMLILIPLTITVCRILAINPIPYLVCQMIIANTGCLIFMTSSFSNVLIGSAVPWTFSQFFLNIGLYSFLLFAILALYLILIYRKRLDLPSTKMIQILREYNAWLFVKDKRVFYLSFITLIVTIILFAILPNYGVKMDIIAMSSGVFLLLSTGKNIDYFLKKIDFQLILYLLGIFLIIGAVQNLNILDPIAEGLYSVTEGDPVVTSLLLLWLTAGLTAGIDNIPLAKILIPITQTLTAGFTPAQTDMAYSATVFGIHLGDNLTPLGDNIIIATQISKSYEQQIPSKHIYRVGPISALLQLTAVSLYLMIALQSSMLWILILLIGTVLLIVIIVQLYRSNSLKFLRKQVLIA